MNQGKKYPHEREYDEDGLTPRERREQDQYDMAKAMYRGQKWAQTGFDPGDPDEPSPILNWFVGITVFGLACHLVWEWGLKDLF